MEILQYDKEWNEWDGAFIKCHRDFSNYNNEKLYLNIEQYYIYALLRVFERNNKSIRVTLNILNDSIPIRFSVDDKHNRNRIKKLLEELYDRSLINSDVNISKIKAHDTINLFINDEYIEDNEITKGFEKINTRAFFQSKNIIDFYIHSNVAKYMKLKNKAFFCSYDEWSRILGTQRRTTLRHLENAIDNKAVFVNIGKYTSKNKQDVNSYRITSFDEKEKSSQTKKKERKVDIPF